MFFESEDGHDGSVDVDGASIDRFIDILIVIVFWQPSDLSCLMPSWHLSVPAR